MGLPPTPRLTLLVGSGHQARVASSDPKLWADIFLTNKTEIKRAGEMFEKYYSGVMKSILKGDYSGTVGLLKSAKSKRDRFIYGKKA